MLTDERAQNEENIDLQNRSAAAVASFISFCYRTKLTQPPEKIVKNLCTFLCQDVEQTPTFAYNKHIDSGILSAKSILHSESVAGTKAATKLPIEMSSEDASKARLSRRGAELAFTQLSVRFGDKLFDLIPKMWEFMAGGLLATFPTGELTKQMAMSGPSLISTLRIGHRSS